MYAAILTLFRGMLGGPRLGGSVAVAGRLEDTLYVPLDHPAIRYYQKPADPVARLEKRLENSQAKLDFGLNQRDLTTLLRQLDINESRY